MRFSQNVFEKYLIIYVIMSEMNRDSLMGYKTLINRQYFPNNRMRFKKFNKLIQHRSFTTWFFIFNKIKFIQPLPDIILYSFLQEDFVFIMDYKIIKYTLSNLCFFLFTGNRVCNPFARALHNSLTGQ